MQPMPYRPSVLRTTGLTLGAAAAGIATFLVAQGSMFPADGSDPPPSFLALMVLDLLLGLAAVGLLPLALRRAPLGAGLPIIALSSLSSLAFIPACMALIGIAALRRPRALIAAAAAYAAAVAVDLAVHPDGDLPWWAVPTTAGLLLAVLVLVGLNRGARRQLIRSLQHEAQSAHREQEARTSAARLAERTRIAREMHDTLSHRLSLISMHAGALEYRSDLDRDTIRATAAILRETAQTAAGELRTVLSVLREDPAETAPQPALDSIPGLVASARAAGSNVTLQMDPPLQGEATASLPDATSRHLYRIVQEGLTNAQKHAPRQPIRVSLTGAPGQGITVAVSNPLPAGAASPGAEGLGLVGLAERARLAGGSFETGVRGDVYATTVKVPW